MGLLHHVAGASMFGFVVFACDESTGTDGGSVECTSRYHAACDCDACVKRGGRCADGCADAGGSISSECYPPAQEPGSGEFSCEGLLNCSVAQVCFVQSPPGDGCYKHSCISAPPGCENDVTCACITQMVDNVWCDDSSGGVILEASSLPYEG